MAALHNYGVTGPSGVDAYAYRLHSSLGLTSVTLWNSLAVVAHLCIPDVNSDGLYFDPLITLRVRVHNNNNMHMPHCGSNGKARLPAYFNYCYQWRRLCYRFVA